MEPDARIAERAALAWPTVAVDHDVFLRYLETSEAGRALLAAGDDGMSEPAAELWLTCAIAEGSREALERFEERYVMPLARRLGSMKLTDSELDEVMQRVRTKLLVRDASGRLRLEEYAGTGKMSGLVQVVATREAVSMVRESRRETAPLDDDLAESIASSFDPGLAMLKGRAREAFRGAFASAVTELTARQRNLLRLHILGGVTFEQLATMHGVNRSTVVRWIADARAQVSAATKHALATSLEMRADELESLMQVVSQLDASFDRLLGSH